MHRKGFSKVHVREKSVGCRLSGLASSHWAKVTVRSETTAKAYAISFRLYTAYYESAELSKSGLAYNPKLWVPCYLECRPSPCDAPGLFYLRTSLLSNCSYRWLFPL